MKHFIAILLTVSLVTPAAFAATPGGGEEQEKQQKQQWQEPTQEEQAVQEEEALLEDSFGLEEEYLEDDPFPRPRPHYPYAWRCIARDRGHEEHWGGHVARGRDYHRAYYRALQECRRYHGRCYVHCNRIRF